MVDSMIDYAMRFVGIQYKWGGENSISGFDCSGFIQECLRSVGLDPPGDQTANALYKYFSVKENGLAYLHPARGALAFYGRPERIIHVALCINHQQMIEAGGGNSQTVNKSMADEQDAFIRIRPYRNRQDFVGLIKPFYPTLL